MDTAACTALAEQGVTMSFVLTTANSSALVPVENVRAGAGR
jgi:hypothetical protein